MKQLLAIFSAILMVLMHYSAQAQSSYDFLQLGVSARAGALGGAFVSMGNDPTAVYYNPGSLSTLKQNRASATFMKHVLDISSGQATYVIPFDSNDVERIAISAVYCTYGSFDETDAYGVKTGTFSANNVALSGSYSNQLDRNLYYGITGKLIYSTLADAQSSALAVDAGVYYAIPESRTNIGFSLLNIGTQLSSFDNYSDKLPLDVRLGINHRLRGLPLLLNFSFHHLADDAEVFFDRIGNFSIGGEFILSRILDLRFGYDNIMRKATSSEGQRQLSGFSAGVGVKTQYLNIDYGISAFGTAGSIHRLSVNTEL